MIISNVQRHRTRIGIPQQSPRSCFTKYFIRNERKEMVPVCAGAFIAVLHISRHRLNNISSKFHATGNICDRRGGYRASLKLQHAEKKQNIIEFINKLNFKESHYCRSSTERKYLTSDPLDLIINFRTTREVIEELKKIYSRENARNQTAIKVKILGLSSF